MFASSDLGDMQSPTFFIREAPALAPFVDNANLIALTRKSGEVFLAWVAELRLTGFVLRDEIWGQSEFRVLGHGPRRSLRTAASHSPSILASVVCANKGDAKATRHWRCASRARGTPLSSIRAFPGTGGDSRGHCNIWKGWLR